MNDVFFKWPATTAFALAMIAFGIFPRGPISWPLAFIMTLALATWMAMLADHLAPPFDQDAAGFD